MRKKEEKKHQKARMNKFYSKQGQEIKEQEQKEKEFLKSFFSNEETQKVFQNHDQALFPLFKKYSTQDRKQEIGEKVALKDDKTGNMTCNEFLKFSRQYGLGTSREMN